MTGYIGCAGLIGIAIFIALLFVRRKKIENELSEFYRENSLFRTENCPSNIRESLGGSENIYCCAAKLTTIKGETIEFCWWEWYIKSNTMVNGVPTASYDYYLAVSFAPNTVSDEFVKQALRLADKSDDDFSQKAKDFFVLNTDTPYRAEKLADGSLIICRRVLKRRDIYDAKIMWLKNNVTLPAEIETPGTIFYKHETYPTLRDKFTAAWSNLELELHHDSAIFQHEGRDEFAGGAAFGDPNLSNEIAFSLTNDTTVGQARKLFSDNYGCATYILRDGLAVADRESLTVCNLKTR